MQKLKLGITGAGGFIGSHLVKSLESEEIKTALINGAEPNVANIPNILIADISDFDALKSTLEDVNRVVHLAGLASVRESFENPEKSLSVNTLGTLNLLNVCKELDIRELIIISSAEVYGNPIMNPVSEDALLKPLSPYGVSKVALEQMCFVYHKAYGINIKILRPFSIYGPRMSRKSIIYEVYQRMLTQGDITLFNAASIRDYCYIDDLISAIKNALFSDFTGFEIYNIGTGIGTNSKQLAELIQTIMGVSGAISESAQQDRPKQADVNYLVANISKAEKELKWKQESSLADGLRKTINYFTNEALTYANYKPL